MNSWETAFFEESFTNELDQVINPGDEIVMVTTGYAHSVDIRRGTYLGVRKNGNGEVTSTTCSYPDTKSIYNYDLPWEERYKEENIEKRDILVKTNLWRCRIYKLDTNSWDLRT